MAKDQFASILSGVVADALWACVAVFAGEEHAYYLRTRRVLFRLARREAVNLGTSVREATDRWQQRHGFDSVPPAEWRQSYNGQFPNWIKPAVEQLTRDHALLATKGARRARQYAPNMAAAMIQIGLPQPRRDAVLRALISLAGQHTPSTQYEKDVQEMLAGVSKVLAMSAADVFARAMWMFRFREEATRVTDWIENDLAKMLIEEANEAVLSQFPWGRRT